MSKPLPTLQHVLDAIARRPSTIHARTEWCPSGCSFDVRLMRRNLSLVHAEKGCKFCKRKFTFIRTDTPEGRAFRTKAWLATKNGEQKTAPDFTQAVPLEKQPKKKALTGGERMAKYRQKKTCLCNMDAMCCPVHDPTGARD